MKGHNYARIEMLLQELLENIGTAFSETESKEVRDFIDAGEYGLAIETFADIVNEEAKHFPPHLLSTVRAACEEMGIDVNELETKLMHR